MQNHRARRNARSAPRTSGGGAGRHAELPLHPTDVRDVRVVLQGTIDQVCSPSDVRSFVSEVPSARLHLLDKVGHGFSVTSRWGAIFAAAVAELPTAAPAEAPALDGLDLPLRMVPAASTEKAVLVFLSGDGGWADLDQSLAVALAERQITTIGWSSLRYFWRAKSPDELVADTNRILQALAGRPVFLGGYSFGADVFAYLAPRFEKAARGVVLIGTEKYATFEVSPLDWIRTDSSTSPYDATVSLSKTALPWLCLESEGGAAESGCPAHGSALQRRRILPGGHHFQGDYDALARTAADWMDEVLKIR